MIVALGTVWGLHFSLMKMAGRSEISFPSLSLVLLVCNALMFYAFCKTRYGKIRIVKKMWWFYLGCGVLGYLIPFYFEMIAAPKIGAGNLAIVVSITPLLTMGVAFLARIEKISLRRACGIFVGFFAILPIIVRSHVEYSSDSFLGIGMALVIPLTYALYHNFIGKFWPDELEASEVSFGETLAALIIMSPIYISQIGSSGNALSNLIGHCFIFALVIASALEVILYFYIVRMGGPVFVSQASYITVISGLIWGYFLFDETVNVYGIVGAAGVIGGLWLVSSNEEADEQQDVIAP